MGWQDREYGESPQAQYLRLPPATLSLFVLHAVAFLVTAALQANYPDGIVQRMMLGAEQRDGLGIALHPFAVGPNTGWHLVGTLFLLFILWKVVAPLERILGAGVILTGYVLGCLLGGAAYWLLSAVSALAFKPLIGPVGALAAWVYLAWRGYRDEVVDVFGRYMSFGTLLIRIACVVVALGLLLAGVVGGLAWLGAIVAGVGSGILALQTSRLTWSSERVAPEPEVRKVESERRPDESDLDALLAKISRAGIDSLTAHEKSRLEEMRQSRLRRDYRT